MSPNGAAHYGKNIKSSIMEKFNTGRLFMTKGVNEIVKSNPEFAKFLIASLGRHCRCDWGELCDEDREANENALNHGERLFSVYGSGNFGKETGEMKIWIITEADRSTTTVLFPSEY